MKRVVVMIPKAWHSLPDMYKNDVEFARTVKMPQDLRSTIKVLDDIFQCHPFLRSDQDFWMKLISSIASGHLSAVLKYAATDILANRVVMLTACKCNYHSVIDFIDPSLWGKRDFVEDLVECRSKGNKIQLLNQFLPHQVQTEWPDLFAKSLAQYNLNKCTSWNVVAQNLIAPGVLHNRIVKAGGKFFDHIFPTEWKCDKEIFLLIAKHPSCGDDSFVHASPALTSDKDFMLQAVKWLNQTLIFFTTFTL